MYHKVFPESLSVWWVEVNHFYRQMAELRGKKVVFLEDYDPSQPDHVVITFDGVYKNILTYAAPILQHFSYPFELFITSDYIDNSFDSTEPLAEFADEQNLRELVSYGGRLQWHTRSHPNFGKVKDPEIISLELDVPECIRKLDPKGFRWFTYPYGNYDDYLLAEVKQRFTGAVSCHQGNDFDRYILNRITVTNKTSFQKAKISVIIASYNYGTFLMEAVQSVLHQTRRPDEIIIMDDESGDSTEYIGMEFAKQYPGLIRYYRNGRNLGIVGNFNKGVSLATSEYICILGADNRFRSDYIEKTAEILDLHEDVAIAYTDFALFGPRAKIVYDHFNPNFKGPIKGAFYTIQFPNYDHNSMELLDHKLNFIHGSSLYRKKAFEEVGGYLDAGLPEDYNLFLRMLKAGWKAMRVPYPLLEYRQHSSEQANQKAGPYSEAVFYKDQAKKQEEMIRLKDAHIEALLRRMVRFKEIILETVMGLFNDKRYDECEALLKKCVNLEPNDQIIRFNLLVTYMQNNKIDEAAECFEYLDGNIPEVGSLKVLWYLRTQKKEEAGRLLHTLLERHPFHPDLLKMKEYIN